MQQLAKEIDYHDADCVNLLRRGCDIVGVLPRAGNGQPVDDQLEMQPAKLAAEHVKRNSQLVSKLREDEHSDALWKLTVEDAALGRMSFPRQLQPTDLRDTTISPRFCLLQGKSGVVSSICRFSCLASWLAIAGVKSNGEPKYRTIDDLSRSSVNAATMATEKLRCDTLDVFFETLRAL